MSKILIAATGGSGHINPLLPFADAYADQGHDVLLIGPPSLRDATRGHPARIGATPPRTELDAIKQRLPTVPHAEATVLIDREVFGRLTTTAMLPTMAETCRDWRPDLVLREPCEYASAIVAEENGIPHAQVAISLAAVETHVLDLVAPVLPTGIGERIRTAPYLTRFPESLDPSPFPATRRFHERPQQTGALPDWWPNDTRPLVYLTLGTVAGGLPAGIPAYRTALAALAGLPVRVLLTVGRTFDAASLDPVPPNTHITDWVPQADVLTEARLVVCHGGSGTTFGALAAGVPVVILPMFADQPANGRLVAASGVGRMVEPLGGTEATMGQFGPDDLPAIRTAIRQVLEDDSYSSAAQRVADEMSSTPNVAELAAHMTRSSG
ncbi:glycosyltransferase [Kutzneria sp. NPDC052558]|uniref:glycosyltransferase n=1 Tax=Kutzneria sp. NPDC052558 TaxID=3364121 RepID=UPI0037C75CB4